MQTVEVSFTSYKSEIQTLFIWRTYFATCKEQSGLLTAIIDA